LLLAVHKSSLALACKLPLTWINGRVSYTAQSETHDTQFPRRNRVRVARRSCRAWLFHFERQDRHREGGFVGDFLNVKRVTKTTGWSFDALVVASDGVVLFRNWGGQPNSDKLERQINPLGPLQPAGESAGALLR
jgi:hypothetical protein